MVADYISEMERRYKGWTIKGDLTVLGRAFDYATRHLAWAGTNPVRGLDKSERPRSDERPKRILSAEELARLLSRLTITTGCCSSSRPPPAVASARRSACAGTASTSIVGSYISHQLDRSRRYVELKTAGRAVRSSFPRPSCPSYGLTSSARLSAVNTITSSRRARARGTITATSAVVAPRAVRRAGLGAEVRDGVVVKPAPTFHSFRYSHGSA